MCADGRSISVPNLTFRPASPEDEDSDSDWEEHEEAEEEAEDEY